MTILKIIFLTSLLIFVGCSSNPYKMTHVVKDQSGFDKQYLQDNFELVTKNASLALSRHFYVYIPFNGFYDFSESRVVGELLKKYDGDLVTNVTIEKKVFISIVYNRYYVLAKGDVWRRRRV